MSNRRIRIGIDVGGTFTKAIALDIVSGEILSASTIPTTHTAERGVSAGIVSVLSDLLKESQIKLDEMILDIGPKTVESICNIIDNTNTILWNGPAGYFENPNFANGSTAIAKKIVEKYKEDKIYSVVGGGDTVSFINSLNAVKDFNFVSTAGGAFLEYLEGKELPGISALN